MKYAVGNRALAICDRCGVQVKYQALMTEWQGLRVCPSCYEEKHPQLGPFKIPVEPQALYKPRPEAPMALEVVVGENRVFPPWQNGSLHMNALLGEVEVTT
jgi:hypothetical protein